MNREGRGQSTVCFAKQCEDAEYDMGLCCAEVT